MSSGADRISDLPLGVLHKILSNLNVVDSTRTCVLSKLWNSARKSLPKLVFRQRQYMRHIAEDAPDYKERLGDFLRHVDTCVRAFDESELSIASLSLFTHRVHADFIPLIDTLLPLALRNGVKKVLLKVMLPNNNPYRIPESMFSAESSMLFHNLVNLRLYSVILNEKIVRDITRSCPNIIVFTLWYIRGLKRLDISQLHQLNRLSFGDSEVARVGESIFVDAPSLEGFACRCFKPCALNIASCVALKYLDLEYCPITDEEFDTHIRRFSLLETLKLSICNDLRMIKISLPRLKTFCINQCFAIESIHIDAPTLSSFTYMSDVKKFPLLSSNNHVHCSANLVYNLRVKNVIVDMSWFVDLRKFLGGLTRCTNLRLSFSCGEISFDPNVLGEAESPALVEVDHLELKFLEVMHAPRIDALWEGLLWSCHPKAISFSVDNDLENVHLKTVYVPVLCHKLMQSEDRSCCSGTRFKCWRHHFIDAKSSELEWMQLCHALELPFSAFMSEKVEFSLEWDYDKTATVNEATIETDDKTVKENNEELHGRKRKAPP